jgi:hypothetical protein
MAQFQPMGVGEILDQTFKLYRKNLIRFLAIMAVVQVPITLVTLVLQALLAAPAAPTATGRPAFSFDQLIVVLCSVWLSVIGMTLARGALSKSVSESYLGNEVSVGEAYRFVLPKFGRLIWASILVGLIIMLGFVLFIVPGVIFSLWFALAAAVVVIEDRKATESMGRSRLLAKGNLGKIFLVSLTVFAIALVIGLLCSFAAGILGRLMSAPAGSMSLIAIQTLFNLAAQIIAGPIGATAIILLYYDLRIRKEGFDLEMLAKCLGPGGVQTGAAPQ